MKAINIHRIFHAGAILIFCSIFFISFRLQPSQTDIGTHTQLRLPPCIFLKMTGLPCPSCGMTTSFAQLARGNILGALKANPAGPMLAAVFILIICTSARAFVLNRPWNDIFGKKRFQSAAIFVIALYIGIWILKILALKL